MSIDAFVQANRLPQENQASGNQQNINKDEFLRLMVTQLQQQDPLNPMDNQAMAAQMAQFASVEQMSNLNDNFAQANTISQFMDSTRLLGRDVSIIDPASPEGELRSLTSKVKSVNFTDEGPLLHLENGMVATVQDLIRVEEPVSE